MSCGYCDELREDGSSQINDTGRFLFFLEKDEAGSPQIVVKDLYNEVGGDGIYMMIDESCISAQTRHFNAE